MQYQGDRQISTYMTGPHLGGSSVNSFLPAVGNVQGSWKAYDSYPAPAPLRRSLTTIPWSPSVYYSSAKVNHSLPSERRLPEPLAYENHMSQQDSVKIPALFSAARNALYTRYTPADWNRHKKGTNADQVRSTGERLRLEGNRLANELEDKTKNAAADVGKKLGDRVNDIDYWRTELSHETDEMLDETAQLDKARKALETFIKESENQVHIARECLYNREKRQGVDLVHDEPEKSLITEVDLTRRCQEMARTHLNRANGQLNLNRAAQHELEKDSKDKHIASTIDRAAFNLKETSRGLGLHRGVERVDNTVSVPESWAEFTNNNIKRSQSERMASKNMRNDIQNMLNHASDQMWKQWNKVNSDLTRRIQETMDARNKIQHHLAGTLQEIFDTEKNIEMTKKAINDKMGPLKVATTRLENRLHRPNMEGCRDPAQKRLVQEVHQIDETIESLTNQLRSMENQLQALLRKRSSLEHDLAVKNNSLFIDQEKCMGMRKTYPIQNRVFKLV